MKFSIPRLPVNMSAKQLLKVVLATTYTIICAVIILPRIDHQSWYPEGFRSYDIPPGLDFSDATEVSIDIGELKLTTGQKNALISELWNRISSSTISDADISLVNNQLMLRFPSDTSFQTIALLLSQGSIEILSPKDPDKQAEDPLLAYDRENFNESPLKLSELKDAEYKSQAEQFAYIDISVDSQSEEKWNTFVTEQSISSVGLSIDGQMYQAWMLPPSTTPNPSIAVPMTEQEARVLAYLMLEDPLPFGLTPDAIDTKGGDFAQTLLQLYILLSATIAVSILLRRVLLKEKLVATVAAGMTVAGFIAILKLAALPLTLELFVAMLIISTLALSFKVKWHLQFYIFVAIAGILLTLVSQPSISSVGHFLIIAGIFGSLATFFYEFINIYEEK